jgi:hypothetical protein
MPEPAVVHDSGNDRFLLVGGGYEFPGTTSTMETWSYSPERGYRPIPTPTRPPTRDARFGICKHLGSGLVVMFGDQTFGTAFQDARTWVFDGRDWTGSVLNPSPAPFHQFQMAYDSVRDRVLTHGLEGGGFWSWTPSGWTQLPGLPSNPVSGSSRSIAAGIVAVLWEPVGGVHEFHPSTGWVTVPSGAGTSECSVRIPAGVRVRTRVRWSDPCWRHRRYCRVDRSDDTWLWDGTTWTLLQDGGLEGILPAPSQPIRRHQAAYDPERQRIIEFGNLSTLNETDYNQILGGGSSVLRP